MYCTENINQTSSMTDYGVGISSHYNHDMSKTTKHCCLDVIINSMCSNVASCDGMKLFKCPKISIYVSDIISLSKYIVHSYWHFACYIWVSFKCTMFHLCAQNTGMLDLLSYKQACLASCYKYIRTNAG